MSKRLTRSAPWQAGKVFALIFMPIGCWIYNLAAGLVGGLEITVVEGPGL